MGKIVQIIDSFYAERLSFRICEVVGTYNNPFAPPSRLIVGSNKFLSWEFDEWLPKVKDFVNLEKKSLRYGRVVTIYSRCSRHRTQNYGFCNRGWIPLESADV